MKYWRGFLAAAILALCSWALISFAAAHSTLVDMVYPYVTRTIQTTLSDWTSGADFVLWQVLLAVLIAGVVVSGILVLLLRKNLLQWLGWVLAVISAIFLLHTGIYGMNEYAGSVAGDIRMSVTEFTLEEMEKATTYFRDQANALSSQINRNKNGNAAFESFDALAQQAGEGFTTLVYDRSYSIFAGSVHPVKKLAWAGNGTSGSTCALTGEAAVNPKTPAAGLPFAMCREMARRMCIAADADADFSAFLAAQANTSPEFQYSAYMMAYRLCFYALESINSNAALEAANRISAGISDGLSRDLTAYNKFAGKDSAAPTRISGLLDEEARPAACDLLVSWYIQEFILPTQVEQDSRFDPYDESQVDLSGIVNTPTQDAANAQNSQ